MRQTFSEYHDPDERLGLVGEDRADEFARPDRRLPEMLLTGVAMALFAGGLWFAYVQGTRHPAVSAPGDPVPLIRADDRPTKVKPEQPVPRPAPGAKEILLEPPAAAATRPASAPAAVPATQAAAKPAAKAAAKP